MAQEPEYPRGLLTPEKGGDDLLDRLEGLEDPEKSILLLFLIQLDNLKESHRKAEKELEEHLKTQIDAARAGQNIYFKDDVEKKKMKKSKG
jgi:hypothetical protein